MVEIPDGLLRRSAEAKAKALGISVEQVLAEMTSEIRGLEPTDSQPPEKTGAAGVSGHNETETTYPDGVGEVGFPSERFKDDDIDLPLGGAPTSAGASSVRDEERSDAVARNESGATTLMNGPDEPGSSARNSAGNGQGASVVTPRRSVPPTGLPEGVRTQRLLTVVKARAIQDVRAEPTDKVNTWPHLMLMEFASLLLLSGFLVVLAVIIHSPLLEPANFNATPNPSKAPWYFLGLQELLSYFDPQIAGVMVPLVVGFVGFMIIPYVDKNPSTRPTDRKFAIMLYSLFLAGSATLTIIGVFFRGPGFNWAYPWEDGIYFDDLRDWLDFE